MTIRSAADWQALFTEHEQSGLSAAAFCRERKLCSKNFNKRRKQSLQKSDLQIKSPFIPLALTAQSETAMLEYHIGNTILKIPLSISANWNELLQEQLDLALAKRYAASSEKTSADQLRLFDKAEIETHSIMVNHLQNH